MIRKRHPFTLLEILVVIAILTTLGGFISINIKRVVYDQRFKSEVASVLETLRLAQNLMLLVKQDVHVIFKGKESQEIDMLLSFDFPIPPGWEKELKRKRALKTIHRVEMEDGRRRDQGREGELDIQFLSGGDVMSQGILLLSNHYSEAEDPKSLMNRYICLLGYPSELFISEELPECPKTKDIQFKEQLTDSTVSEIHALQKS